MACPHHKVLLHGYGPGSFCPVCEYDSARAEDNPVSFDMHGWAGYRFDPPQADNLEKSARYAIIVRS